MSKTAGAVELRGASTLVCSQRAFVMALVLVSDMWGRHKWHQSFTPLFEGVQHLSTSGTSGCQNKNPSHSLGGWKEGRGEQFKVVAGAMRAKCIVKSNSEDQNVPHSAPEISSYFHVFLRISCLRHPSAWWDLSPKTIKKKVKIQFKVTFYEVYVQQTSRMGVLTTAEHTLAQVLLLQHRITAGAGHRIKQQTAPADLYWVESHKWESHCSFGWLSHAPRSLPNTPGQTSNHFKSLPLTTTVHEQEEARDTDMFETACNNNVRALQRRASVATSLSRGQRERRGGKKETLVWGKVCVFACRTLCERRGGKKKSRQSPRKPWYKEPVCEAPGCPSHWTLRGHSEWQRTTVLLFRPAG